MKLVDDLSKMLVKFYDNVNIVDSFELDSLVEFMYSPVVDSHLMKSVQITKQQLLYACEPFIQLLDVVIKYHQTLQ